MSSLLDKQFKTTTLKRLKELKEDEEKQKIKKEKKFWKILLMKGTITERYQMYVKTDFS